MFYVSGVEDLDELLVGEVYISTEGFPATSNSSSKLAVLMKQTADYFPWIHLLDDDVEEFMLGQESTTTRLWVRFNTCAAYNWQPLPFLDKNLVSFPDDNWTKTYRRIAVVNSILEQLQDMADTEDPDELTRVEGEACFLRAFYYFWLVNLYTQPYDILTAGEELGIPVKTSPAVEDENFSRASLKAVYEQIEKDLERAIVCLRGVEDRRPIRASIYAAHLLMSRVALYTEDYERAVAHADSVILCGKYHLLDLNTLEEGKSFTREDSPETVFTQGGYIMGMIHTDDSISKKREAQASAYTTSKDLLRAYDVKDLRLKAFFVAPHFSKDKRRCLKFRENSGVISDYMLMRLPEAYLNKAEAQAILGQEAEARTTLQSLREMRFAKEDLVNVSYGGEELVSFIRDERRRELCFEGHRWFDLRRYAVNNRYPFTRTIRHVTHEYQALGTAGYYVAIGEYVLKPYPEDQAAYVFPIPEDEILINDGWLKPNPDRPDREVVKY